MDRDYTDSTRTITLEGVPFRVSPREINSDEVVVDSSFTNASEDRLNKNILDDILNGTTELTNFSSAAASTSELSFKEVVMQIIKELGEEHPDIAIDPDMVGGMPHIKGVRLSVGTVLAKLHYYGSIEKVKEVYGDDISEHQLKEALAYAQDFLERTYVQSKSS